jgi:hypothetical protein
VTRDAAEHLVERGRGPSAWIPLDRGVREQDFRVHKPLLGAGIFIIEAWTSVDRGGPYLLSCLPLSSGVDGPGARSDAVTAFAAIADDLTARATSRPSRGRRTPVRVEVAPGASADAHDDVYDAGDDLVVVNTQSRALTLAMAAERVRRQERHAPLALKKIDTALRGHLSAELDGARGARRLAFVSAIPPPVG